MKKYRFLSALLTVVLLLSLLTACQALPDNDQTLASTPSSSRTVLPPPIYTTTSPSSTTTVPSSTAPAASPDDEPSGLAFIFEGYGRYVLPGWYPNKAEIDYLYWVNKTTKVYVSICEEPVIYCLTTNTHVYFIKEAEPTNIYVTPIGDFSNHELLSETPLPVIADGLAFIYHSPQNVILFPDWCYSRGTIDHLYWVVQATKEVFVICDEPVTNYEYSDTHLYFVKASEPTNIYRTPIGNFSEHELVYTSTNGSVSDMTIDTYTIQKDLILQFVADNKKFMILDLNTGEDHFIMEQYYIESAMFEDGCTDTWEEQRELVFYGKPTEEAKGAGYFYNLDTGEIEEIHECED
jgi:hypothetical protein